MEKRTAVLDNNGLFAEGSGRIRTYMGGTIDPINPDPADVTIEDIAHSLALQCRFTGHVSKFYSVAQHSVLVSTLVPENDKLWGLLHDGTEAYLADIARPIKLQPGFGEVYRAAEDNLMRAIAIRFDLDEKMPASVKQADTDMLGAEMRDLMKDMDLPTTYKPQVMPWKPLDAERYFLHHYRLYTGHDVDLPKDSPPLFRDARMKLKR